MPRPSANAPALASNPFNLRADYGLATYDVRHMAVINAIYALPFGRGQAFANGLEGWGNALVSGWSVNSIVTLQSGFPFTPQLSYNPSNNGDTRNPVRPFVESGFHRAGDSGKSQSVVQSERVSPAAGQQRILWQSGERHFDWSGSCHLGFLGDERNLDSRTLEPAVSRGDFQSAESSQFQYSEPDCVHSFRSFRHRRSDHQHLDHVAAGAIRIEADLVENPVF